ncbi:MAG: hypothetical protein WB443_15155 [Nitrososphaeraceae archaeon]
MNNGYAGVILCISTEVYEVHRDKINERAVYSTAQKCFAINDYRGEPKREVNVYEPTLMIFLGSNNNNLM